MVSAGLAFAVSIGRRPKRGYRRRSSTTTTRSGSPAPPGGNVSVNPSLRTATGTGAPPASRLALATFAPNPGMASVRSG